MSAYSVVSFSATVEILNRYIGEAGGSADQKKTQTIGPNCSMTHSPGKIEYNCRYFIMTFRKQIEEYKFGKNCSHTLQSTMSHRLLTNTSSLKIAAAYWGMFSIFDPHTSKARYEVKVVLLHLWRVRVKTSSRIARGPKSYDSTETLVLYRILTSCYM